MQICASDVADDTIIALAKELTGPKSDLFIKRRLKVEAYKEYGEMLTKEAPEEQITRLKRVGAAKCEALALQLAPINAQAAAKCTLDAKKIADRAARPADWYPNQVDSSTAASGAEVQKEAEAEAQKEVALELMVQTEVKKQVQVEVETVIPIVNTGQAGHRDVHPISEADLKTLFDSGLATSVETRPLGQALPFFDKTIFCSSVFERNMPVQVKGQISPQAVFYSNRKPVTYVVIAQKKDGSMGMVVPTIHEAHNAAYSWTSKRQNGAAVVKISPRGPVMLYKSGKDRNKELPFTGDALTQFYRHYVQAKLLNGEIDFNTDLEKDALKAWLKEVGVTKFKDYFEANILAAKPRRFATNYPKSTLFAIMKEVAASL